MNKDIFSNHRNNSIAIVVMIILFISVVYLPKSIWDYEDQLRDESRFRMRTVAGAEKLHYQLVKSYTTDPDQLIRVVNGVRDSLLAAANDSTYSYYGHQRVAIPGKSINVNYSDEYKKYYEELHLNLFKKMNPHHHMEPELVTYFLDSIRTRFDETNYIGSQQMDIDSISLSFDVSGKYDILYQNINTSMFNALTGSYTKYQNFSNPLVNGVMDSLAKNPTLRGRVEFANLYDGPVRIDFIIPFKYEENLEKTKLALKKQFVIDSYDSATYGDTLYNMALENFMNQIDTLDVMPKMLTLMYEDTSLGEITIPVEVKVDDMETALDKRRNTLYTMLTGYSEPSSFIANKVLAVALDSLHSPNVGIDSFFVDIDLTGAVFNLNLHNNIFNYYNKVSLEQTYYHTSANLSDLDWNKSAIEVVEYVASQLRKRSDFSKWQIIEASTDTFHVNIMDNFLRRYDDMNLKLYQKLTGEFTNIFNFAYDIVDQAEQLASIDSLDWSGAQVIVVPDDTILVDVFPTYLQEYDTTFIIPRDTVIRIDDSTFQGVWYRNKLGVTQDYLIDSLPFLSAVENADYKYDFNGTDSVRSYNVLEKSDSSRVEKIYYGANTYIMIFTEDSLMENLYRVADEYVVPDSMTIIDTLNVVSDEFVVGDQEKDLFMSKDSFGGWLDTMINKKYVKKELYTKYRFAVEHTKCSVTDIPYRITVRNNVNLTIESPITKPIETRRYLFFTQVDSSHGRIVDGEESWIK
ncbi:MAG: hypothetical protein K9N35_09585 [Candidatus Marinimicrobia bacterium]|nr:hypothetical protein [Candidatus Neomarinimicrobiota bacterium]